MVRKFAVRSPRFAVEQWRESYVPEGLHKGSDSTELAEGPGAKSWKMPAQMAPSRLVRHSQDGDGGRARYDGEF